MYLATVTTTNGDDQPMDTKFLFGMEPRVPLVEDLTIQGLH